MNWSISKMISSHYIAPEILVRKVHFKYGTGLTLQLNPNNNPWDVPGLTLPGTRVPGTPITWDFWDVPCASLGGIH